MPRKLYNRSLPEIELTCSFFRSSTVYTVQGHASMCMHGLIAATKYLDRIGFSCQIWLTKKNMMKNKVQSIKLTHTLIHMRAAYFCFEKIFVQPVNCVCVFFCRAMKLSPCGNHQICYSRANLRYNANEKKIFFDSKFI